MEIIHLLTSLCSRKRVICLVVLLALVVGLLCLPKRMVAEPANLEEYSHLPRYGVQELRAWGQGQISMPDKPLEMDGYRIYKYRLSQDLLEAYIAMLQTQGFTLVDEHHQSSFLGSYQSYGLRCDAASEVATRGMMYTGTPCHVNIWKSDSKWRVEVVDGITMCDLGLRQDGSQVSVLPRGDSLGAGLRRTSGGYKTDDGRLKTKLDQVKVICDGKEQAGSAAWKRSGERIFVTVERSDDLTAEIVFNEKQVEQGDVFLLGSVEEQPASVTITVGSKKITAQPTGYGAFHTVSLRIMHLGKKGDVVLYLYAEPMDTEMYPESIELLCAVNTTPEEKKETGGSGGGIRFPWEDDDPFQPNHSKLDCLTCRGSGNCTTCGGDGYTDFGDAKGGCRSCHGNGNCRTCGGSGKR